MPAAPDTTAANVVPSQSLRVYRRAEKPPAARRESIWADMLLDAPLGPRPNRRLEDETPACPADFGSVSNICRLLLSCWQERIRAGKAAAEWLWRPLASRLTAPWPGIKPGRKRCVSAPCGAEGCSAGPWGLYQDNREATSYTMKIQPAAGSLEGCLPRGSRLDRAGRCVRGASHASRAPPRTRHAEVHTLRRRKQARHF